MHEEVRRLLAQMADLEAELRETVRQHEDNLLGQFDDKRAEIGSDMRAARQEVREHLLRWLAASQWRNVLSAPLIYALIVPFALLHLSLEIYQAICFRLYRIPRVKRSDYIIIDRHRLPYLNSIERLNCVYCGYGNGLIAYAREIAARTEQYWCPIKHARTMPGTHSRYARFLDYGDEQNLAIRVRDLRDELRQAPPP
jgi:hypothetical protein